MHLKASEIGKKKRTHMKPPVHNILLHISMWISNRHLICSSDIHPISVNGYYVLPFAQNKSLGVILGSSLSLYLAFRWSGNLTALPTRCAKSTSHHLHSCYSPKILCTLQGSQPDPGYFSDLSLPLSP